MRRAKVLEEVPALSATQLDYLAQMRYVKFKDIPGGEVFRRDFLGSEIPYLKRVASLLGDGLSPRKASQKAREEYPG